MRWARVEGRSGWCEWRCVRSWDQRRTENLGGEKEKEAVLESVSVSGVLRFLYWKVCEPFMIGKSRVGKGRDGTF
jgi:hypothetical protein